MTPAIQDSNLIIEAQLHERLKKIEELMEADALAYVGPIAYGAEDLIKNAIEDIEDRKEKIVVILETLGGYIESAERIARALRHHYPIVDFLVPNFALSAGTVLVMSGDAIHMDYSSVLGPIDPQVQGKGADSQFVPALGYLEQYERLVKKSKEGTLSTAELTYLVENFDAAELYRYEQERELSIKLLKDWLVKYKFKNWTKTKTRGKAVTNQMRTLRASQIARQLNKISLWGSHSRGIPMEVLRKDLNLQIDDFGATPTIGSAIREYYRLLKDYSTKRGHYFMILHIADQYGGA